MNVELNEMRYVTDCQDAVMFEEKCSCILNVNAIFDIYLNKVIQFI